MEPVAERPRGQTRLASLARLGFADPTRAAGQLTALGLDGPDGPERVGRDDGWDRAGGRGGPESPLTGAAAVVAAIADSAEPDLALSGLVRLAAAAPDRTALLGALRTHPGTRSRLTAVLGASAALGEHLARHPEDWRVLADDRLAQSRPSLLGLQERLLEAVGAPNPDGPAATSGVEALDALRVAYRRALLPLAARDLVADLGVDDVAGELADLASATLGAALAIARAGSPPDAPPVRLAIVGMGKCGGRELNYVSDVDVVFVAEPGGGDGGAGTRGATASSGEEGALRGATALAAGLMRVCSQTTSEGSLWPVDAALRPEGRAGPLVRTLASHVAYYRRWAKTWEFQALLKARPVAGDLGLGARYVASVAPLVWSAADRPGFVEDVQAMRRRVQEQLPPAAAARELKLGPGGLRDVEFAVQLLQLVHGRADPNLRSGNTLLALGQLAAGGYVGRADAAQLDAAYRFLRLVEHRLQLQRLRRTHTLPTEDAELRWLARAIGYRRDPLHELAEAHAVHTREVRRLHEKLFYRPLLTAVARLPGDAVRLTPAAARTRLEALGFVDPVAALRHLEALMSGVSRRASIQRTLLPVMLARFADAADPDGGLLAFRQVSEALGSTPWYLRLLRDEGSAAERLAGLLATSRYVADLLVRAPEAVAMLAQTEELVLRPRGEIEAELVAMVRRNDDNWEASVAAARALRRRELLRIAAVDLLGGADLAQVGRGLADAASATLQAALLTASRKVEAELRGSLSVRLAVIGMGRLGGGEQGYGSDADVMFVYEPVDERDSPRCTQTAHDVAHEMRRLLALPAPDPPLFVDADLRPEGRQGPLVRSLGSFAEYYRRWAQPWEHQALLRAVPVAGDPALGAAFLDLVAPLRWPPRGLPEAAVREVRRVKARIERERIPRGADRGLHTKLGHGGLADVEWTVQLLQLRFAGELPALRTPTTMVALRGAVAADLLSAEDADVLETAWCLAARIRNAVMLVRGRPSDTIPLDAKTLLGVAQVVGYAAGHSGDLLEDYRRTTRRARAVVEKVFYQ